MHLQCEKEYHIGCLKDHNMQNIEVPNIRFSFLFFFSLLYTVVDTCFFYQKLPEGNWYCCSDCDQIHTALQNLVACGEEHLSDSLLSLIKKKHEKKGLETESGLDIKWRVLNWKMIASEEIRPLLSQAVAIFHVSILLSLCLNILSIDNNSWAFSPSVEVYMLLYIIIVIIIIIIVQLP